MICILKAKAMIYSKQDRGQTENNENKIKIVKINIWVICILKAIFYSDQDISKTENNEGKSFQFKYLNDLYFKSNLLFRPGHKQNREQRGKKMCDLNI